MAKRNIFLRIAIVCYYCGCPPRSALILNQIEGFEMASNFEYQGSILAEAVPVTTT